MISPRRAQTAAGRLHLQHVYGIATVSKSKISLFVC